jgi:hypothetical protein
MDSINAAGFRRRESGRGANKKTLTVTRTRAGYSSGGVINLA